MAESKSTKDNSSLDKYVKVLEKHSSFIKTLMAFCTGLLGFSAWFTKNIQNAIIASIVLIALIAYVWFLTWWKRRPIKISAPDQEDRKYLRGLLPFEDGENLLGREHAVGNIMTMICNRDFQIGYVSGAAGVGKTSLLRAGILPTIKKEKKYNCIYYSNVSKFIKAIESEKIKPETADLPTIFIIDQFEEFFQLVTSKEARSKFFNSTKELITKFEDSRILISLRKEYVDDLLDLAQDADYSFGQRNRFSLKNWDAETAFEVLNTAAEKDGVPFARLLVKSIIEDLVYAGTVKPVELQIVATRLRDLSIWETNDYNNIGGARGVLTNFVSETIAPHEDSTPELERQLARITLKSLCSEFGATKHPTGLTSEQILELSTASLKNSKVEPEAQVLRDTLTKVLQRLISNYVLTKVSADSNDNSDTYNIAHDYLVPAIMDATADLDSAETKANRLLEQHITNNRTLNFKDLLYVQNFSSKLANQKPEARLLIRNSRGALVKHSLFYTVAFAAVGIACAPKEEVYSTTQIVEGKYFFWKPKFNNNVAVSFKPKRFIIPDEYPEIILWNLNKPWKDRLAVNKEIDSYFVSKSGNLAGFVDRSGNATICSANKKLKNKKLLEDTTAVATGIRASTDDKWIAVSANDGKVYLYEVQDEFKSLSKAKIIFEEETDSSNPKQRIAWFDSSNNWLVSWGPEGTSITPLDDLSNHIQLSTWRCNVFFDKTGERFSWLTLNEKNQPILSMKRSSNIDYTIRLELPKHYKDNGFNLYANGGLISAKFSKDVLIARTLKSPLLEFNLKQKPIIRGKVLGGSALIESRQYLGGIKYSNDGNYVAAVANNGRLYVWKISESEGYKSKPIFGSIPYSAERNLPVKAFKFSPDSKLIGALHPEGSLHVWPVDKKPNDTNLIGSLKANADFYFSKDSKSILAYDNRNVFAGHTDGKLHGFFTAKEVQTVMQNQDTNDLLIFTQRGVHKINKRMELFDLPITDLKIPKFDTESL